MIYNNTLSITKKAKATPFLIQKYGNVCWYDKEPFVPEIFKLSRTIDHLNCNEQDNRFENLVLCHWECQQKKRTNPEMQIIAMEQLKKNTNDPDFLQIQSLCEREKKNHTDMDDEEWTEGQINKKINQMVETYLNEKLPKDQPDNRLPYTETVNCISYLVQKETGGRGSPVTVRRAIDVRCSSVTEFEIIRESGKRYIIKRIGV